MGYSARMWRCRAAGKPRHRQIETAPEKMHRAAFAAKAGSKLFEHPIALQKHTPKSICVFGVVGPVLVVALKGHSVHNFVRRGVDLHGDAKLAQGFHNGTVKLRNTLGLEFQHSEAAVVREDSQFVRDEIEMNLECAGPEWDRARGEAARGQIK